MKVKTINKTINAKFDQWLASIKDERVRNLVEKGTIMTGGAIASMLLREPVNDYDFYFKDFETTKAVAEYYVAEFIKNPPQAFKGTNDVTIKVVVGNLIPLSVRAAKEIADSLGVDDISPLTPSSEPTRVRIWIQSAGIAGEEQKTEELDPYQYFEGRPPEEAEVYVEQEMAVKNDPTTKTEEDYRPVFLTDNAISLSGQVQMVIRFYGTPDQIHENYDYVHATNYWTSWDRKVTLMPAALECLLTKELRYIGSKYPICSLVRARKFIQRDWTINAGQFLKIAWQINELNLKDFNVLREQLVGMDMAYFSQVLTALHEKDPTKINGTYLIEVIDRIFG
jgi:hypothetical protein